jgi:hypothetical protein
MLLKVHIAPVFGFLCSPTTTEYSTRPVLQSGPCAVFHWFSCGRTTQQPEDWCNMNLKKYQQKQLHVPLLKFKYQYKSFESNFFCRIKQE